LVAAAALCKLPAFFVETLSRGGRPSNRSRDYRSDPQSD
jgi:hypothetical protein